MLQWRYDIESVLDVPASAFEPPPQVESAIVRMLPLPQAAAVDAGRLGEIVAVAFSQRRKILRHTLGRYLDERGFGGRFDVQRRAEEVPVAEFVALAARAAARNWCRRQPARRRTDVKRRSGGVQPHRGVEGAAHQRHVHAEAAVRCTLGGRLDRLVRYALGHLGSPLP